MALQQRSEKIKFRKQESEVENINEGDILIDRISDLHDNLREKILECLPISDAILTSELSSIWRFTWNRIGQLVFDESVVESMGSIKEGRFTRIIERILLAHQGMLQQFCVCIPHSLKYNLSLNGWFISLSRKKVQQLEIRCNGSDKLYSMPSYFFDCGALTRLLLEACVFRPPPCFQGFPNLVSCGLLFIDTSSNQLAEFITSCPRIETLELREFLISFSGPLDVNAPNLKTFYFTDGISGGINLKNTPCLTTVSLNVFKKTRSENVLHMRRYSSFEQLKSLTKIKKLTFDLLLLEPLEEGVYPDNLGNEFVSLETLTVSHLNICKPSDLSFIFCLARSSPNLKTLSIYMDDTESTDKASVEYLEKEGKKKVFNLSQLLTVTFDGITGLKSETMLLSTMLSSCPVLKTLTITASKKIKENAEKMAWALNSCRRLSRDVVVLYRVVKKSY